MTWSLLTNMIYIQNSDKANHAFLLTHYKGMEGNSFNSYVFYWFLNTSLNKWVCPSQGRYKVVIDTICGILTSLVLKLQDLYSKTYIWKRKQKEKTLPILVTRPSRESVIAQCYGPWVALVSHSLSVFSTPSSSPYGCASPPAQVLR